VTRRVISYPGPQTAIEQAAKDLALAAKLARIHAAEERARAKEAEAARLEEELRRLRSERKASRDALKRAFEQDLARRLGCRVEELI
jgi:hypothetical protein